MAINLSSLLGQLNNNSQAVRVSQDGTKIPVMDGQNASDNSGLAILKNMLSGDTFTGKIMSLKDDTALIMLNDGSSVSARLSENANVTLGQNMTFLMESNTVDNISLKPLGATGQEAVLIDKALEAANLSPSESNINIVSSLLDMNMPIDAKTLGDMVKYSAQFPDKDLNTIANLLRLEIPVTEENIVQFDAYRNMEHTISGNFSALSEQISETLSSILDNPNENQAVAGQTLELVNNLYTTDANGGNTAEIPSQMASEVLDENEFNALKEIFANSDLPEDAQMGEVAQKIKDNTATVKDVFTALTQLKPDAFESKPELKTMLSSEITPKLAEQMINETLRITPENIAKEDGIKNYYKRVKAVLEKAGKELEDESFSPVNKNLNQVKANIDFMNDLNKNMTYFQMPVHFKHSNGDGELYVFTNKKALSNNSDSVSAMLHLDMDNLGPMDIYVKMTGKNVSTNFCLESEELLDFVYSNIDKLNARLEALGYSTKFEMNVTEKEKQFDFVENFVEKDIPAKATSQYVFDIKA
jgi:hypothetical protein